MSSKKPQGKGGAGSSSSGSAPPPPGPPPGATSSQRRKDGYYTDPNDARSNNGRGGGRNGGPPPNDRRPGPRKRRRYSFDEKDGPGYSYGAGGMRGSSMRRSAEITIVLCTLRSAGGGWRSTPVTFRPLRTTDEELWRDIRQTYQNDIEKLWRRLFTLTKVKSIVPIEFTRNDTAKRQDPKDVPASHELLHCYHHAESLRTQHEWVDWFVDFKAKQQGKTVGLEFIEGIWAEKLALLAIAASVAIVVVSIVWCVKGGNLQTVFTVMGFVLSMVAALLALLALYYQIASPG